MFSPEVKSRYTLNVKAPAPVTSTGNSHNELLEVTHIKERIRESDLREGQSERTIKSLERELREIRNKLKADFNAKYDAQIKVLTAKDEIIRDQRRRLDQWAQHKCGGEKAETIVEEKEETIVAFELPSPWREFTSTIGQGSPLSSQEREVYKGQDMSKVWEASMIHISGLEGCVAFARNIETGNVQFYDKTCFGKERRLETSTSEWTTYTNGSMEDIIGLPTELPEPTSAEPAPAPAEPLVPPAATMKPRAEIYAEMMNAFDIVDEDEAELAPRLDLRKQIDLFLPDLPQVQTLSDMVRAMDAMIVEREEYEEVVQAWLKSENIPE